MLDNFNYDQFTETYVVPWGINIVLALLIFIIGRVIAKAIVSLVRRVLAETDYDAMLVDFLLSVLNALLLILVIIAALDRLGVNTTSVIAVLGAAGLAIGLSLQNSLQNFAAGMMLLIFHPFKSGDYVEAGGTTGTVDKISIFTTLMTSTDNKQIVVPNRNIYEGNIINYTALDTRRIDMVFGISYDSDLRKAKEVLLNLLATDDRILREPAAKVAVLELADNSVNIAVRPWVKTKDAWTLGMDFNEAVKLRFDEEGIVIPFPQLDINLPDQNADSGNQVSNKT